MHSHPEAADTLIVGAQLYDGTGAPPVERDVAVRDGRIVAIGNLSNWLAEEVIEAEGRALAPGFIDVHTHDDTHVIRSPQMLPKITQGVTTVIVGNCGISASPVALKGDPPDPMNLLGERDAFQYPTFADVRRSGERRAAGGECRRADRPYGVAQQSDGPARSRGDAAGNRRHARAARRSVGQRRAGSELGARVRLGVRRADRRSDGAWPNRSPPPARCTPRTCAPSSTRFSTRWTRRIASAVTRTCRW